MDADIGPLAPSATREAAALLARAFADDPIITHYLHDPRRRKLAFPAFFRSVLAECLPHGSVHSARMSGRLVGVAAWIPPEPSAPDRVARVRALPGRLVVRLLFPRSARDLSRGFATTEELHPHEPHWYLAFVGIDPAVQGHGIGSSLLAPILRSADERQTLCYLETPFPRTHDFYRRLGFEVATESRPFVGAPPLWTMIRNPSRRPSS